MTSTSPDVPHRAQGILRANRNCWRIAQAERFRLLIDGDDFFRAVRQAVLNARESLFIVGWDIDADLRLMPSGAGDGFPESLSALLKAAATERPGLRIYILGWDFSMLYALEREWRPFYQTGWETHRRVVGGLDGHHPLGASHHQKIIVVDDALAFVGGMDLTRGRWDTPDHTPDSPLRQDAQGVKYAPVHDVQAMFDGSAARAMGRLVRERWRRFSGRQVHRRHREQGAAHDPWPKAFAPDVTDVRVGIARTEPAHAGRGAVQEILQFQRDAIAACRNSIYIESQYFTSRDVGQALVDRLAAPDAPDTVVVSRKGGSGWLDETNVAVLRARLHRRLRRADAGNHYRLYYAAGPGWPDTGLNVHSKLGVFDDEWLCVGSANLSNRSMALDTECCIILDAMGDPRVQAAIAGMRARLLAEHLECDANLLQGVSQEGLVAKVESLRGQGRTLDELDPEVDEAWEAAVPAAAEAAPERPTEPDALIRQFVPVERQASKRGRYFALGGFVLFFLALTALWKWTPLAEYLEFNTLTKMAQGFRRLPYTPLVVLGGYVLAGLFSVPITILIVVTGVVFGATLGGVYALSGTLLSALVTYGAGRLLGRDTVRRLAGSRINAMSERMAQRGLVAMVILRLLPVAPFTMVNVIAGASQISLRDYVLGTMLGMGPGIVITVIFAHNLAAAMRNPSPGSFAMVAVVAVALLLVSIVLHRVFLSGGKSTGKLGHAG